MTKVRRQPVAISIPDRRDAALTLGPALLVFAFGFLSPLINLAIESLKEFTPGRVGSVENAAATVQNYYELANQAFASVLLTTFWIGGVAAIIGQLVAFPLAYFIVRRISPRMRTLTLGFLITLVLSSVLIKTYAIELTFGSVGIFRPFLLTLGLSPNSREYINIVVVAGLVHSIIPVATLTLIGAMQSIDPRLLDAAQSLGAPGWKAHLSITLPLSFPALISSTLVSLTFAISAFVIPMVLGRGRVLFMSNVIYTRFSDIANYPSGAAISLVMVAAALAVVAVITFAQAWKVSR
ncbi:ABC transporter permease [Rhizobium leguminosarum]|uniref:ABC transporter permease n=1 Tax=Rhizobium leguminosarum TaxID=384 RepID=UPI00103081F3|nr:ABC transporter permease [Rhizobium leguminosarum]TBG70249.1 ABC transporter permease [Rhizobium leguminosarum]